MAVKTTHTLSLRIAPVAGVMAAPAFTNTDLHVTASSSKSAEECKQALAHWLSVVTAAVERELS